MLCYEKADKLNNGTKKDNLVIEFIDLPGSETECVLSEMNLPTKGGN